MKKEVVLTIAVIILAIALGFLGYYIYGIIQSSNNDVLVEDAKRIEAELAENEGENMKISFKTITADEAKAELDEDGNIIVLDVRTPEEYSQGHIPNCLSIPLDELRDEVQNVLKDKDTKIFVYCQSGVRSVTACNTLIELGYTNVYNMGGIIDWTYGIE